MSDLSVSWIGGNRYVVHSPGDDSEDHEYAVNLNEIGSAEQTCTCKHGHHNGNSAETCRHVRSAIDAHPAEPDLERFAFEQLADLISSTHDTLNGAQRLLADTAAVQTNGDAETAQQASSDSSSGSDGDGVVDRSAEPNDDQQERLSDVEGWIAQAAGFAGFDPSIVEAEWAVADGTPGVAFDTTPFPGGYHDGDSWQDQDGFDAERETFRETMQNQDEVDWYGEPDYDNFVPAETVPELTE